MAPWPYSNNFHSLNGVCSPVCNGNHAGRNGNRVFGILKGFIIEGLGKIATGAVGVQNKSNHSFNDTGLESKLS